MGVGVFINLASGNVWKGDEPIGLGASRGNGQPPI